MSKEAVAKFLRRCPNKGDYCMTDMQADWLPRGDIEFEIKRGCSSEPERKRCLRFCAHRNLFLKHGN